MRSMRGFVRDSSRGRPYFYLHPTVSELRGSRASAPVQRNLFDTLIYASHLPRPGAATAIGFVLIDIEPTHEKEVYERLMKIEHIVELYPLFGEYDLIAKVEAESYEAIGNVVVSKIRMIEGVKATKTLARMSL